MRSYSRSATRWDHTDEQCTPNALHVESMSTDALFQLSLCMIVRNEQATLRRCLDSVRGLVDEIIVVDTGSTDESPSIARECGARVVTAPWENDFSGARNRSLELARGKWILVLDADEYFLPQDRDALMALLHRRGSRPADRAFNLVNKSSRDGGRTGLTGHIVRLFPNRPDIRYHWPIHEQVVTSLQRAGVPVENTNVVIIHTGYSDPVTNRQKQLRNRAILEQQIATGTEVTALTHFLLAGCLLDLGEPAGALERYRASLTMGGVSGEQDLAAGARVRIVSCLNELHRWNESIDSMPAGNWSSWHPELIALRAEAAVGLGRPDDARVWYERLLDCGDRPCFPACNVPNLKIGALKFLGEFWYRGGLQRRGIALLRAAKSLHEKGGEFTQRELRECYAQTADGGAEASPAV